MKVQVGNTNSGVVIAGAGPAGSSLAIRLAVQGFDVTIIERDRFPRHKLCGEFISPECLSHFGDLGILESIFSAGGERIAETRFYDRYGHGFSVPSSVFAGSGYALSLSRSEMDHRLLVRAGDCGVKVLEGRRTAAVQMTGDRIEAIETLDDSGIHETVKAGIFVDATGRGQVLSKLVERAGARGLQRTKAKPSIALGFKTHVRGARVSPERCEIYSFPGGYGGLSPVENGVANLCFLMDPRAARKIGADADVLVEKAVCGNQRAAATLENAVPVHDWLAVSVNEFGQTGPAAARNLFKVGDAAAFIDPFTGSGILMALESAALLADAIAAHPDAVEGVRSNYDAAHRKTFSTRLRICSLLRRTAFLPVLPSLAIRSLEFSKLTRMYIAGLTRPGGTDHVSTP